MGTATLSRRGFLATGAASVGALLVGCAGAPPPTATPQPTPEPYTRGDWKLRSNRETIKGFADRTSAADGETVGLYVTTAAPTFDVEVYRLGWYEEGQSQANLVHVLRGIPGRRQETPIYERQTGLVSCAHWQRSAELKVAGWRTGIYLLKLKAADGDDNYVPLVVRDDRREHDFQLEYAAATDQAYNPWGGKSLYEFNSSTERTLVGKRAAKVSFDRPYHVDGAGAGTNILRWTLNMVRFLEASGFDVAYVSDVDVHRDGQFFRRAKAVLQVGHNEYWSKEMYDHLEAARDAGRGLGFFSGDTGGWSIRFEDSALGKERVVTCYKDVAKDPLAVVDPSRATVPWAKPPLKRTTHTFMGVGTNGPIKRSATWTVAGAEVVPHLFKDTGLSDGDQVPNLVGYEYDGMWTPGAPDGEVPHRVLLGAAKVVPTTPPPARKQPANRPYDEAHTVAMAAPGKGPVIAAGTNQWSWALDDFGTHKDGEGNETKVDPRVQALTRNMLRALKGELPLR